MAGRDAHLREAPGSVSDLPGPHDTDLPMQLAEESLHHRTLR
jgi:hypothetical protein